MPEIILITLAWNLFRVLKNEVRNQKNRKGGCKSPIKPNPFNKGWRIYGRWPTSPLTHKKFLLLLVIKGKYFGGNCLFIPLPCALNILFLPKWFEFWQYSTMVGKNFESYTSQMHRNTSELSRCVEIRWLINW